MNQAGRVNGNLNLSRSLGDLKYKQNPYIAPKDQLISAEPDITVTEIQSDDQFVILACDGIWDCVTCQEACDFVVEKLEMGMNPVDIAAQLCRHCLADDPRQSTGIGGDNMTCLIIRFQVE